MHQHSCMFFSLINYLGNYQQDQSRQGGGGQGGIEIRQHLKTLMRNTYTVYSLPWDGEGRVGETPHKALVGVKSLAAAPAFALEKSQTRRFFQSEAEVAVTFVILKEGQCQRQKCPKITKVFLKHLCKNALKLTKYMTLQKVRVTTFCVPPRKKKQ